MGKYKKAFERIYNQFCIDRFAALMNGISYDLDQPCEIDFDRVKEAIVIASQTFVHILHVKKVGYPTRIAFHTSDEAEKFASDYDLKGCRLESIQFCDYDYYSDKINLLSEVKDGKI